MECKVCGIVQSVVHAPVQPTSNLSTYIVYTESCVVQYSYVVQSASLALLTWAAAPQLDLCVTLALDSSRYRSLANCWTLITLMLVQCMTVLLSVVSQALCYSSEAHYNLQSLWQRTLARDQGSVSTKVMHINYYSNLAPWTHHSVTNTHRHMEKF